jgi:hypothetical protein
MNYGKSRSSQESYSGLRGPWGNQYAEGVARVIPGLFRQGAGLAQEAAEAQPFTFWGQPYSVWLPTNEYGLAPETTPAVEGLLRNTMSRVSGNLGSRGFVSPYSNRDVAASTVQNTLPQLLPLIQQYQIYRQQWPQEEYRRRLDPLALMLAQGPGLLGGQGQGASSSFGFGILPMSGVAAAGTIS